MIGDMNIIHGVYCCSCLNSVLRGLNFLHRHEAFQMSDSNTTLKVLNLDSQDFIHNEFLLLVAPQLGSGLLADLSTSLRN